MSNYSIQDESSDHKYFSLIPHIIFEIGLSANQIALYMAIKRSAGEKSQCTRSSKNLANQAGLSKSVLYRTLPSLCEINSILKKPLIKHSSRLTHCGDRDTNLITIIDIWHENFEFIQRGGGVKMTLPSVKSTPGVVSNRHQGSVKMTHKEEHIKKNLYEEELTPPLPSSKKSGGVGFIFFRDHVSLSKEQHDKLIADHGAPFVDKMLDILDAYKGSSGKQYKSDFHTMKNGGWVHKRTLEDNESSAKTNSRAVLGGKRQDEYDKAW
jgi:hypothetical protein